MSQPGSGRHLGADEAQAGHLLAGRVLLAHVAWSDRKASALALVGFLSSAAMAFAAGLVAAKWLRGGDPSWAILALALGLLACLALMRR